MKKKFYGFDFEWCRGIDRGCPHCLEENASLIKSICDIASHSAWEDKWSSLSRARHHQKLQVGISGCPNACARVQIKDIGILLRCTLLFHRDKCKGCGECVSICREGALFIKDGTIEQDKLRCLGCGECVSACGEGALQKKEVLYEIMIGGRLGRHPRFAIPLGRIFTPEDVVSFFKKIVYLLDSNLHLTGARELFGIYSLDFFKGLLSLPFHPL